jgi:hypothetical protein
MRLKKEILVKKEISSTKNDDFSIYIHSPAQKNDSL